MSLYSFIAGMAKTAGWPAVVAMNASLVRLPFESDEGDVNVFIRPCGKIQGKTVLEFSSLGVPLPTDAAVRMAMMEAVLERNGNLLQGYWGIEGETEKKLAVLATQIAETMDQAEFEAAVNAVLNEYTAMLALLRKLVRNRQIDF